MFHEVKCLVVILSCSSSACEHNWSIEGGIHSRRNRLGQDLVEPLVSTHTNLHLEYRLELYETGILPWDIEMTVEESGFGQTTRTGSLTESLTPSLNPKMTLTKFMSHVTPRVSVFFYFCISSSTLFLYLISPLYIYI
jgi:hypothetical protein